MQYALVKNVKTKAIKGINDAVCPCCQSEVMPCVGRINRPHFRHINKDNCDTWSEGITKWHLDWQDKFQESFREIIIEKNGVKHIADIKTTNGTVIEFQNSFISPDEIYKRENFYGNMIWVFNIKKSVENFETFPLTYFGDRWDIKFEYNKSIFEKYKNVKGYNWKYPKKHIYSCRRYVFLDIGDRFLYFVNFYNTHMPKFNYRTSTEVGNGYWESEVIKYYHPLKVVKKSEFISYYNK